MSRIRGAWDRHRSEDLRGHELPNPIPIDGNEGGGVSEWRHSSPLPAILVNGLCRCDHVRGEAVKTDTFLQLSDGR